ncbi:hypothetical protein Dimus_028807, partial [Dionaea muscipula]
LATPNSLFGCVDDDDPPYLLNAGDELVAVVPHSVANEEPKRNSREWKKEGKKLMATKWVKGQLRRK